MTPITPGAQTEAPGHVTFSSTATGGLTNGVTWKASAGTFVGNVWTSPNYGGNLHDHGDERRQSGGVGDHNDDDEWAGDQHAANDAARLQRRRVDAVGGGELCGELSVEFGRNADFGRDERDVFRDECVERKRGQLHGDRDEWSGSR